MSTTLSRRSFLAITAAAAFTRPSFGFSGDTMPAVPTNFDHMILGVSDLDQGIAWMEEHSGVRAVFGGVHPGRGTRNALLALGPRRYLEIMAPDPAQAGQSAPGFARLTSESLQALKSPQLIGWAVHTDNLDALAKKMMAANIDIQQPREGSRARPDGKLLRWKTASLRQDYNGLLPFFIEWSRDSVHPSEDAPGGNTLQAFAMEAVDAKEINEAAGKMGFDVVCRSGKKPLLRARILGKKGEFELT
ncbi:MAG TPA: VOC family protein [Candidatus Sulfotelmatobacter sp.]|nr:VOC family protein [Candidatus Sulfotelmatobacter sp.]